MRGKLRGFFWVALLAGMAGAGWLVFGQSSNDDKLWQHRNLGKAFYENPTLHKEAVDRLARPSPWPPIPSATS